MYSESFSSVALTVSSLHRCEWRHQKWDKMHENDSLGIFIARIRHGILLTTSLRFEWCVFRPLIISVGLHSSVGRKRCVFFASFLFCHAGIASFLNLMLDSCSTSRFTSSLILTCMVSILYALESCPDSYCVEFVMHIQRCNNGTGTRPKDDSLCAIVRIFHVEYNESVSLSLWPSVAWEIWVVPQKRSFWGTHSPCTKIKLKYGSSVIIGYSRWRIQFHEKNSTICPRRPLLWYPLETGTRRRPQSCQKWPPPELLPEIMLPHMTLAECS